MKAQFVSENMDFERGVDPKKTMGVGMLNKDISDYNKKQLEDYFIDILPLLFPDVKDFRELLPGIGSNYRSGFLNRKASDIISAFKREKTLKVDDSHTLKAFNPYEFYHDYIKSLYFDDVSENINFERGQEPKTSMDIGLSPENVKEIILQYDPEKVAKETEIGWLLTQINFQGKYEWNEDILKRLKPEGYVDAYQQIMALDENINFERGRDPKASMGVGLSRKIADGFKSLSKDPLVRQESLIYSVGIQDRGRYSSFPDDVNLYMEIDAQEIPTKELMEEILDKHIGMEYFAYISENNEIWHIWILMIKAEYDVNFREAAHMNMNESMDFERGQDPKKSLNIGKEARIKRDFYSYQEAGDWVVRNLDLVTDFKYSPNDKIRSEGYNKIPEDLAEYIQKFAKEIRIGASNLGKEKYLEDDLVLYHEFLRAVFTLLKFHGILITEKLDFERGQDSYKSLRIGEIHSSLDGMDYIQVAKRLYRILPLLLDDKKIPDDILQKEGHHLNYDWIIEKYISNHHSEIDDTSMIVDALGGNPFEVLAKILFDKGYKPLENDKPPKRYWEGDYGKLNEAMDFERGQNPKASMGIGMEGKVLHLDPERSQPSEIIETLKNPWDWIGKGIWFHDFRGTWSLDYLMGVWEYPSGERAPYDYVKYKGEYYKMNPERLKEKPVNETMNFERGKDPKEALDIGTGKMIPYNWADLTQDLQPYLIDYHQEYDVIYLDVDGKMDPTYEVTPIINGYLENWATVERYEEVIYDAEDTGFDAADTEYKDKETEDYRFKIRIKPEYISIFGKALRDEIPY